MINGGHRKNIEILVNKCKMFWFDAFEETIRMDYADFTDITMMNQLMEVG